MDRLPVMILFDGRVLVQPSWSEVVAAFGTRLQPDPQPYDVAVVGGGLAGLSAAIHAASEGLRTVVIEREIYGGQAGTSSRIRNYLGFPRGISGRRLIRSAREQALQFGVEPVCGEATGLRLEGKERVVLLRDGSAAVARAVVIATGVSYRRLGVPAAEALVGAGVFYGSALAEAPALRGEEVVVVGAANSAGQAAVYLARFARRVTLVARGESLEESMSAYLVDELRLVMIAADVGRAVLLATVPTAAALHALTLAQLVAVVFLNGTLSLLFSVSAQTLFVSTVPRERYVEGMSLQNGSRAFSFVGGPSIAGFLVQALSAPVALVADAVSYLVSALSLGLIRPAEPPVEREPGQVLAGVRFILRTPVMRAALAATATINLFNFAYSALAVLYMVRDLHVTPSMLGLVLGSGAVGGLIGSVITGRLTRRIGIGPALLVGCVAFPVPLVLVPLAGGPMRAVLALLFLAVFGAGMGVMILDISAGAIFAAVIPNHLRARASGAYVALNYGIRPMGALLGGAMGIVLGVRPTLLVVTICAVAGFLWLLPSPIPRMATLPRTSEAG
jgi:thioredoxin reductase